MSEHSYTYQEAIAELDSRNRALRRKDRRYGLVSYDSFDSEGLLGEEMIPDKESASVEDSIEQKEERAAMLLSLRTSLTLLPEVEYLLVKKIFLDGMSQREFSRKSGIPQKTLQNRLQRILQKLRCFTKVGNSFGSPP